MNANTKIPISTILTNYDRKFVRGLSDTKFLTRALQAYPNQEYLNPDTRKSNYSTKHDHKYSKSYPHNASLRDHLYNGYKPFEDVELSDVINMKFLKWLEFQVMLDNHIVHYMEFLDKTQRQTPHDVFLNINRRKTTETRKNPYMRRDSRIFNQFNYALALCMIEKKLSDMGLTTSDIYIDGMYSTMVEVGPNGISETNGHFEYSSRPVTFNRSHIWDAYAIVICFTNDAYQPITIPIIAVNEKDRNCRFVSFTNNMKRGILHYIHKYQKSDKLN